MKGSVEPVEKGKKIAAGKGSCVKMAALYSEAGRRWHDTETIRMSISGNPSIVVQNMPGAGSGDRGKLCLWPCQARRINDWRDQSGNLHGPARCAKRSSVRLGEICLAWNARANRFLAFY